MARVYGHPHHDRVLATPAALEPPECETPLPDWFRLRAPKYLDALLGRADGRACIVSGPGGEIPGLPGKLIRLSGSRLIEDMHKPIKPILVAGARPNFMKIAPLMEELSARGDLFEPILVHTGQHYDESLSRVFFDDLGIPRPHHNLEVGSDTHAQQTAEIMRRFEPLVLTERPDVVVVVGDVNSTIACALVAAKLGVKVAHVEAGLRSFNRRMPEEINRVLTDAISDLLFVSERSGLENLKREGIPDEKVHFVGNVMIDTLLKQREKARGSPVLDRLGLRPGEYGVLTMHRPSNVDSEVPLRRILSAVSEISRELTIVFPVHPRTRARLEEFGFAEGAPELPGLRMVPPLGYLEFLRLQSDARLVLTDSGGLQEEATVLGVPCLTLRSDTERPVTLLQGTNVLVGSDPERILVEARKAIRGEFPIPGRSPELWDGQAAKRIVEILKTQPAPGALSQQSA